MDFHKQFKVGKHEVSISVISYSFRKGGGEIDLLASWSGFKGYWTVLFGGSLVFGRAELCISVADVKKIIEDE